MIKPSVTLEDRIKIFPMCHKKKRGGGVPVYALSERMYKPRGRTKEQRATEKMAGSKEPSKGRAAVWGGGAGCRVQGLPHPRGPKDTGLSLELVRRLWKGGAGGLPAVPR